MPVWQASTPLLSAIHRSGDSLGSHAQSQHVHTQYKRGYLGFQVGIVHTKIASGVSPARGGLSSANRDPHAANNRLSTKYLRVDVNAFQ